MQLNKRSIFYRIGALVRWVVARVYHRGAFKSASVVHIGRRNRLMIELNGSIELGPRVHLSDDVELQSRGVLRIGKGTSINRYSRIVAYERIEIGDDCAIAQFVTILDHDHRIKFGGGALELSEYETNPIYIGSRVWIGDKVSILKGVRIGDNVVIGAHSLVTRDIPGNSIASGSPAVVIRKLDDDA